MKSIYEILFKNSGCSVLCMFDLQDFLYMNTIVIMMIIVSIINIIYKKDILFYIMGAAQTTTKADIINQAITNVILETAQNCQQAINATQIINSSGVNLFGNTSATINFSAACLSNVNMDANLTNSITAAIQQTAQQSNIAMLPSYSGNNSDLMIKNLIATNLTNSVIQNCASSLNAMQQVNQSGLNIGATNKTTQNIVTSCIMNGVSSTGIANTLLGSSASSTVQKTASPLDFISSIFSSLSTSMLAFVFMFLALIAFLFMG
jgi:hypothetical protein